MTEKDLAKHLNALTAEIDLTAKQKTLQKSIAAAEKSFRPIGIKKFILNQLHYIRPVHPALCLLLMILTPVLAANCNKLQLVFFISISVPLLSCITVPEILSRFNSGMMELECSTLYRAGSVFSARLIIYGIMSLAAVLLSAAIAAPFAGSFLWILLFEIILFTASAALSLLLTLLIRSQYAPACAFAVNIITAGAFYGILKKPFEASDFTENISFTSIFSYSTLCIAAIAATLVLAAFIGLLYKKYNFNGETLWKSNF